MNGRIRTVEYYDSQGNVLGAMVQLSVPDAALLQLAGARLQYLVDRSILDLVYVAPAVGARPELTEFRYTERWGATDDDYWALGQTAYWREHLDLLPQSHHQWGFWERNASPFTLVTQALDQVRQGLSGSNPDYLIQDRDTAREILGRQSGFEILRSGRPAGTIHFEFTNLLGRQPNTAYISEGALSRIDWVIGGRYYGLVVLAPRISPR